MKVDFPLFTFLLFFSSNLYASGIQIKANHINFKGSSFKDRRDDSNSFLPNNFGDAATIGIGFVKAKSNTSQLDLSIDLGTNQICAQEDCRKSSMVILGAGIRFRTKEKFFLESGVSMNGLILNANDYNLSSTGVNAQIGAGFRASEKLIFTVLGSKSALFDIGAENLIVMTSVGIAIDVSF